MKISKLFAITLQSKSGLIFFFILAAYNLLLGVYLKDFFELSPMLVTFYLLSALPTLFFVLKIRSAPMRAIVYIVLFLVLLMSTLSIVFCSRILPMMTLITTAAEMMYLAIFDNSSGKDKPLTKIYVLAVSTLIMVILLASYNFVSKPETPYLLNGGTTLWDTQTEEFVDEIEETIKLNSKKTVKNVFSMFAPESYVNEILIGIITLLCLVVPLFILIVSIKISPLVYFKFI